MTSHDFFLTCPNGAHFDFSAGRPCHRKPMSRDCLMTHCDRRSRLHKLWRSTRQIVQNRLLAAGPFPPQLLIHGGMREYFALSGLDQRDMAILPNPVSPFCAARVPAERNKSVLFVGRLESTKGIEFAARACRQAKAPLLVIGDGALQDELRARYPEATFLGRLAPQAIATFARQSRLLVMPSIYTEPFGLTAIEALWSGLPVICTDRALIARDIEQTGAGVAIDPEDTDAFARVVASLMEDDAAIREMSRAAFEDTRHLALAPERWIDALLFGYRLVLDGRVHEIASALADWQRADHDHDNLPTTSGERLCAYS